MSTAVGIDLGTTNTVVAAVRDGLAFTVQDTRGRRLIPSVVSFHPSGNVLVGQAAVERRLIDPENTVYSVKRLIGRAWGAEEVERAVRSMPFKLKEGAKQAPVVHVRGEDYALPEISAFVLRYAKATAEAALGDSVDRAVITVPANFNDHQRAATKVAGKLAGLEVLRILNEPTAAALAYGQDVKLGRIEGSDVGERIAIYDLGGGTFDITLLDLSNSVFEVIATAGDMALGGDDFDQIIVDKMREELLKKHRYDVSVDPVGVGTLRMVAESLKRELSTLEESTVELPDIVRTPDGVPVPFTFRLTRMELDWATRGLVDRTFKVCGTAFERAAIGAQDIHKVVLVGGSTRMPLVRRGVEHYFKKQPLMKVNPDEVVALGAAIQAAALDRETRNKKRAAASTASLPPTIAQDSMNSAFLAANPPPRAPSAIIPTPQAMPAPRLPLVTAIGVGPGAKGGTEEKFVPYVPPAPQPAKPPPRPPPLPPSRAASRSRPAAEEVDLEEVLPEPGQGVPNVHAGPSLQGGPNIPSSLPGAAARPLVFELPNLEPPRPPAAEGSSPFQTNQVRPGLPPVPPPLAPAGSRPPPGTPSTPATRSPLLIDVTPLSLSVETVGGFCDVLIDSNTPVPCDRTRVFLTASDNQTSVFVRVAQGESKLFSENTFLGELELHGLSPMRRGEVRIAVTFEIDADGILNVKAQDPKSGNETKARMHVFGRATEDHEVAAMRSRQERHAVVAGS